MRSGGTQHPEEIINFAANQLIKTPGVVGKDAGDLNIEQQSVPNMSVLIALGHAYLQKAGAEMVYPVRITADTTLAISSNSSGNGRIDAVVLYIDLAVSPDATISNVAKLVVVEGAPTASPTAPTDNDIEGEIGASNPYMRLGNIAVADGAISITTSEITDTRTQMILDLENTMNNVSAKTTPADNDRLPLLDSTGSYVLKYLSFLNLKAAIGSYLNPVGTIREFNVATNPNTLLGFGTWAAHGTGRVTVAIDAGQTEFDALGETGGEKTHTLTEAEMPVHTHIQNAHSHSVYNNSDYTDSSGAQPKPRSTTGDQNYSTSNAIATNQNAGSGAAHNNLQPFIIVHRWVRTA